MSHARQQIREALATAITGLTTTGSNIFQSRVYPITDAELPGAFVFSASESVLDYTGDKLIIELTMRVEIYVKASANSDDTVDLACAEIIAAFYTDTTLGGLCHFGRYDSTEIEYLADLEKPVAKATMDFIIHYRIDGGDPETIIS